MKTTPLAMWLILGTALGGCGTDTTGSGSDTTADGSDATATDATSATDATGTDATGGTDASATTATDTTTGDTAGTAVVTFALTVPPETPVAATVAVVGDDPAIDGAGLTLTGDNNGHYTGSATLAQGDVTWHATLGTQVELADAGTVVTHTATVTGTHTETAEVRRWGPSAGTSDPSVAVIVTVPAGTSTTTGIWISGNQPALGDWNGAGIRLDLAQGGRWATTTSFPLSTALEMKVTRGTWATVEKGSSGEEITNHMLTVSGPYARWETTVATWADDAHGPPTGTGDIDFIAGVSSAFLTPDRDVLVWLPPGYDTDTTRRYPVLYMHDGQNLMDASTSAFGTEWGVDETAQALVTSGDVEPLIIVGVDNTGDRIDEYTESVDAGENGGGNADNYGRFLVEELKPMIDATYRTQPEADATGVAGSSLGGLVSMYFGLTHSETFHRIGVISPSVWWDDRDIVDRVNALSAKLPLHIWLDIGTAEGSGGETVADAQALRDALVGKGWVLGQDLSYTEYPGAEHNEASWAARMDDILRWLYPAP